MTGMVGNKWTLDEFEPMGAIPTAVSLTTYAGGPEEFIETPLEDLVQQIAKGTLNIPVSRTYSYGLSFFDVCLVHSEQIMLIQTVRCAIHVFR